MLIELNNGFQFRFIYKLKNIVESITRELSIIIWISMVLGLIVWSYAQNQHEIFQRADLKIYEQISIVDQI